MKILLDPQIFIEQKFGGISRYFGELWSEFLLKKEVEVSCPLIYSANLHLKELDLKPKVHTSFLEDFKFKGSSRLLAMLKQYSYKYCIRKVRKNDFDIFIPTYYSTYFTSYLKRPFVLTVYDMIHEMYPQFFESDKTTVTNKKLLMDKANKIIAISQNTKSDIIKIYPSINPEKIEVVYLAQSIMGETASAKNAVLPENYLLFIGNRAHYKNFRFLIKAIAAILNSYPGLFLVCAGGGKFTNEEISYLSQERVSERVLQYNYADSELEAFYLNARAFIFPSLYEGFGIPILEAMKCGCPVILSKSSCFPEIAADSALYFEPGDNHSLQTAIDTILSNPDIRTALKAKGLKRESQFTWQETADNCLNVYKSIL